MKDRRLRVGYVGAAFGTYYADEHDQYGRAVGGLRRLADEMDFDLIAVDTGVQEVEQARQAAARMSSERVDFLLIQAAACASGELLEPLAGAAPRIGLWATPEPVLEGSIQLHSLVSVNHYASIIRRYLRDRRIPFKWFLGHIDEPDNGQAAPRDHPGPPGDQDDGLGAYRVDRRCLAGLLQHAVRRGEAGGAVRYEDRPPLDRRGGRIGPRRRRAVGGLGGADGHRPGRRGDRAPHRDGPQRPHLPGTQAAHRVRGVRRAGRAVLAHLPGRLPGGPMHGLQPAGVGGRSGGLVRGRRAGSGVDAADELHVADTRIFHPVGPHRPRSRSRRRPAVALRG